MTKKINDFSTNFKKQDPRQRLRTQALIEAFEQRAQEMNSVLDQQSEFR